MFDIGFWELVIIAIVALLIIGPERLPKFAHDAGHLVRKIRDFIQAAKKELEEEFELDEVDELQKNINQVDSLMKQAPDRFIMGDDNDEKENTADK